MAEQESAKAELNDMAKKLWLMFFPIVLVVFAYCTYFAQRPLIFATCTVLQYLYVMWERRFMILYVVKYSEKTQRLIRVFSLCLTQLTFIFIQVEGGPECPAWLLQVFGICIIAMTLSIQNYNVIWHVSFILFKISTMALTMCIIGSTLQSIFVAVGTTLGLGMVAMSMTRFITGYKNLEIREQNVAAKEKSLQMYQDLYSYAPVIFFTLQPKTHSIINCNKRAKNMLKLDHSELIGKNFISLFDESTRMPLHIALEEGDGDYFEQEYLTLTKDTEKWYFSLSISTLKDNDINVHNVILHNMTQFYHNQRKVEQLNESLIVAKEKADNACAAKSQFLASISHELRTPLHGIICCCDLLMDTFMTSEQRNFVKVVNKSSNMLLKLISNILDFSRIEAGKFELTESRFNLHDCIHGVISAVSMKSLTQKKSNLATFEVKLQMDDNIPEFAIGDEMRFTQVLVNLLGNAAKFSNNKGVITTIVQLISDEGNEQADCKSLDYIDLKISVADQGIGIAPEQQHSLFQRFSQVDSSISKVYGGAGLGLAICKSIVENMGGSIWIDKSEIGHGTTITFTCKFKVSKGDRLQEISSTDNTIQDSYDLSLIKVLVAEDNPINRKVMNAMLRSIGIENVKLTCDGQEAFDEFKREHYDIVLMDLSMPKVSGLEATKMIRSYEKSIHRKSCPVIAVTANATEMQRSECIQAGMNTYVTKPIVKQMLRQVIIGSLREK
jgi:signal transduction histidine kinase/CheY-like chemotaxis protein